MKIITDIRDLSLLSEEEVIKLYDSIKDIDELSELDEGLFEGPVKTCQIKNCCSTALIGGGRVSLSHYDYYFKGDPKDYLPRQIRTIRQFTHSISGVVIGGDPNHFRYIIDKLEEEGIPVVGSFQDGWPNVRKPPYTKVVDFFKDLVLLPKTKESFVILYPFRNRELCPNLYNNPRKNKIVGRLS